MAILSKEEFLKMNQEKTERSTQQKSDTPFIGYFKLADDGDEAIVRFNYSTPDDLYNDVLTVHPGNAETKWKKINCINDVKAGVTNCPLCAAGVPLQQRFFIKLVEYVRADDGSIVPYARVWDRPTSYIQILANLFAEYGDISDCVFKIKRSGAKGDMQTTYSIMFGNPSIYNNQLYVKDFSAFDGYKIIGSQVLDKTFQELGVMAREMSGFDSAVIGATDLHQQAPTPQANTAAPRRITY